MKTSEELKEAVNKYENGDEQAFDKIYNLSKAGICTCIRNVLEKQDNAEDIINDVLQETYFEVSRSIHQLNDVGNFMSWAATIANRKTFAFLKKNKKIVLINEEDPLFDNLADNENIIPESVMQDQEKQRLIKEILDTELTEIQKLCVVGFFYNEQKQTEIAESLDIPVNTVKTNLSRARVKIKEAVLRLEKEKSTKLYSAAPFMLLLFEQQVKECIVPKVVSDSILSSVGANMSTETVGTNLGVESAKTGVEAIKTGTEAVTKTVLKETIKKSIQLAVKSKIVAGVATGIIAVGGVGTAAYIEAKSETPNTANEEAYQEIDGTDNTTVLESTTQESTTQESTTQEPTQTSTETWTLDIDAFKGQIESKYRAAGQVTITEYLEANYGVGCTKGNPTGGVNPVCEMYVNESNVHKFDETMDFYSGCKAYYIEYIGIDNNSYRFKCYFIYDTTPLYIWGYGVPPITGASNVPSITGGLDTTQWTLDVNAYTAELESSLRAAGKVTVKEYLLSQGVAEALIPTYFSEDNYLYVDQYGNTNHISGCGIGVSIDADRQTCIDYVLSKVPNAYYIEYLGCRMLSYGYIYDFRIYYI